MDRPSRVRSQVRDHSRLEIVILTKLCLNARFLIGRIRFLMGELKCGRLISFRAKSFKTSKTKRFILMRVNPSSSRSMVRASIVYKSSFLVAR
jgi:hypothetical protein